ncbi:MAG TPA: antibiotic biosynthesis monooxygenase [Candidatus Limnocylindria bacterium]|jgi:antibiotic biosynthesis monooxygenase (ABM) superfamily enzyme|nr:antibiotic biosynthesis monooxygenase [Candidatus Limnocylindria bacterium]
MTRPALFVVKATIAPGREAAFNHWYDTVRSQEAARVPGCLGMRRYQALPLESAHAGSEPWQYMVCYEFDSEASLDAFVRSDTLRAMTKDYDARFGGAGDRARLAYRQIYP